MKNILIYLPALFLLFGCEDFLNRAAYDQMDSENFYRNAEEINAAVMACYNGIHGTLNNEFFLTEVRSDNTRHEGQGSTTGTSLEIANLDLFKVEPSNTINNAYWEKAYHNIANCNTVLGHSQVVTNVTLREQYDAEARFIRAYHYFNLVRLYGPLFLVTERITAEEAKNYERSTVDAVYRLIIDDLDYASRKLPVKYDSSNIGRRPMGSKDASWKGISDTFQKWNGQGDAYSGQTLVGRCGEEQRIRTGDKLVCGCVQYFE